VVIDCPEPRPRHPKRAHHPDSPASRKPDWIRVRAPGSPGYVKVNRIIRGTGLHTVCVEASCPNIGELLGQKARDLHDHGRYVHAGVHLLQCQDWAAGAARPRGASARRRSGR
jgi:hypothetical protein